jgi:hypothetical protein
MGSELDLEEHLLLVAQRAIEAADVDRAALALDRAHTQEPSRHPWTASAPRLMVLRGDAAVPELRAMTSAYLDGSYAAWFPDPPVSRRSARRTIW